MFESRNKIVSIILLVIFILIGVIWFYYFAIGVPSFDKDTAVTIHDSVIQGISGLGSVAIAVIIFRIQSLENRNQSLEQSTLNYISQTMGWSYPEWTSSVEDDIKSKTLTNRYYARLPSKTDEFIAAERDRQQKRLEEALDLHTRIQQTIRRIRNDVFSCVFFLIIPILLSLLLLMVIDLLDIFWNFVFLSAVILMCSLGILLLIRMVLESTVRES
ncbi:hypothetical protein MUP77_25790 [Candidatus Bathyarchaeota archaeon]|nr:hypothetical protein [Candidatus Bathyarchaeota archaeon]